MPDVSKALIERYSSPESFRRGQGYYRQGAVASLTLRGQELRAKVAGSQFAPYGVRVIFDEAGIIDSTCSCPYEWGGPCKHIVAALLAYAHEPESVRELPELEEGWSYPSLVRVLEGEIPDDEFFDELFDHPLTIARLNVLNRRGRHEEYLRLSAAAGEDTRHAIMLARLDRSEEAVEYASKHLRTPEEGLTVAEALRERGDAEAALVVGERGLSLEGRKVRLAGWVSDLAEGLGRREIALEAALAAFHADPSLASYLRVWELAGEAWPEHRGRLLDHLRQGTSYLPTGQVDVFLHENLVGDAISAVEGDPFGGLVARVADAAIETHPDWVIEACRRQAEEIMNQGRSKDYDKAVDWLAKVRDAYLAAGREEEWLAHLAELIDHHQRKYKLRPMLEDLK